MLDIVLQLLLLHVPLGLLHGEVVSQGGLVEFNLLLFLLSLADSALSSLFDLLKLFFSLNLSELQRILEGRDL